MVDPQGPGARSSAIAPGRESGAADGAPREDEARFRALVEKGWDAVAILSAEGVVRYCSPAVTRILGISPEDFVGTDALARAHPDDAPRIAALFGELLGRPGLSLSAEFRGRHEDGSFRWIEGTATNLLDDPGVRGIVCNIRDVSERKQAEDALRQSEGRFRTLAAVAPVGIFRTDRRGDCLYVNERWCGLAGLSAEEAAGRGWVRALDPEDRERVEAAWYRLARAGEPFSLEYRFRTPGGVVSWVHGQAVAIRDESGRVVGYMGVVSDVTERRRADEALRESEGRFRTLAEALPQLVWTCRPDGSCDYLSRQWVEYTGIPEAEQLGFDWPNALHPDDRDRAFAAWMAAVEGRGPYDVEYRIRGADGRYRWFKARGLPLRDASGRVVRWFGTSTDITDREEAEQELRAAAERLDLALAAAEMGDWTWDAATDLISLSDRAAAIYGIPRDPPWTRERMRGLLHEEDRDRARTEAGRAVRERGEYDIVYRVARPEGGWRWASARGRAICDAEGRVLGMRGVVQDVTHRKAVEDALREVEARFAAVVNHSPATIFVKDLQGRYVLVNRPFEEAADLPSEQVLGRTDAEVFSPEVAGRFGGQDREILETKRPRISEETFEHRGETLTYLTTKFPLLDSRGEPCAVCGIATDITGRKRAESELVRRSRHLEVLSRAAQEINAVLDEPVIVRRLVASAMELAEAEAGTAGLIEGGRMVFREYNRNGDLRPIHVVFERDQVPGVPSWVMRNRSGYIGNDGADDPYLIPEIGRRFGIVNLLNLPIFDRRGMLIACLELHDKAGRRPFTEDDLKLLRGLAASAAIALENARLLREVREADRRKTEFLAMLAHELRNPLSAIVGAVELLKRSGDDGEQRAWSEGVVERQVKHLASLLGDLLDVSRITQGKVRLRRRPLDVAAVLAQAAESARPLVEGRGLRFEADFAAGSLFVEADPTRLEQIVANLLSNAAKYTDPGGRVRLSAVREGGDVVVRVDDDGIGIPPETLPDMFVLFAQGERSLARSEGGLGIGLTLVKMLAELHGGSASAASEGPGLGSVFSVRLPATDARPAEAPASPPAERPGDRRTLRVLIVDDNVDVARGLSRLLRLDGHEVRAVHSGLEALDLARDDRPDVVLLDIGLPGMDGYEVARRLRGEAACEGSLLIAVSGYGQEDDRRRAREAGFDAHLVKPVDYDALTAHLARRGH